MPYFIQAGYDTWYQEDWPPPSIDRPDTVVIQHGFGRSLQAWQPWIAHLTERFHVVRRDLRGHGQSGSGAGRAWTFDGLVDDLDAFIRAAVLHRRSLGSGRVHLIGESTGGMLCAGLAARRPVYLASLTLCATPPTIAPAAQAFFAGEHPSWQQALRRLGARGWGAWLLKQSGTAQFDDETARDAWLDQIGRCSTDALIGYSEVISRANVEPLLPRIQTPALFLVPTRSAATTPDEQKRLASQVPAAQVVLIDGAGHEIYVDRMADCLRAFMSFTRTMATAPTSSGSAGPGD